MAPPEPQRLDYPLGVNSVVLDCGAYQGDFARAAVSRWGCRVFAFEPVPSFVAAFPSLPRVTLLPYGIAGANVRTSIAVLNDSSSRNAPTSATDPMAEFRDVVEVFGELDLGNVDLMKINIEGDEYELLERMIDAELIQRVRYLQVQWHGVPRGAGSDLHGVGPVDAVQRKRMLEVSLNETHRLQWDWPGVTWQSWALH